MPSYINGVDASLIVGLGQIGVTPTPTPTIFPSGGLVVSSGLIKSSSLLPNGKIIPTGSTYFYSRPDRMDSASLGTSTWTKIVSNESTFYLLSSSGELYAMGVDSSYTGTVNTTRVNSLSKVKTGSNWTDIAAGSNFAIGICDGKLFAIGSNSTGNFGNGTTTPSNSNFIVVNNNTYWTKVSAGTGFALALSGSGGSGSLFAAGQNTSGRTGQNTTVGNTLTWTQAVNHVNRMFTDISCGHDFALAISSSSIFGTGEAGNYQLGNNSTTDRTTFGSVSTATPYTRVFAFGGGSFAYSKAINTSGHHYHAGAPFFRGDGNNSTTLLTWTRLNTSGEFASGWQNFFGHHIGTAQPGGLIGILNNRPFYVGVNTSFVFWQPNTTWTGYTEDTVTTWRAFVSSSTNVSCSAAALAPSYNSQYTITQPIFMLYLTPTS